MTDFGADESFGKASQKVKEHYGIEVPVSAARTVSLGHAEAMGREELVKELPKQGARVVIAEMDGSMIPIVSTESEEKGRKTQQTRGDRRKQRKLGWEEARLCVARDPRSVAGHYRATMGDPEEAGWQLVDCVAEAGGGKSTRVHGLGDGAPWIVSQINERFAGQATYLIDFYHVSEYLAAASELLGDDKKRRWLKQQQGRLLANRTSEAIMEVAKLEPIEKTKLMLVSAGSSRTKEEEPATTCKRYLENRLEYLDYRTALKAKLPISSGEVESAHRWVLQARLKIAGAWWRTDNAERMLKLLTTRASDQWESYWERVRQDAA